jgi:hypothetical protein
VRVSSDDSKANVSAPALHPQTVQQPVKPSVRPNFRNVDADLLAEDIGNDGGDASAEDAAVHIIDDEE